MLKAGIGFHYSVSNVDRTVAFYTEKLGFKIHDYNAQTRQARLFTNTRDCLIGFAEQQPVVPGSTCITFAVDNIEQTVSDLQQKGIAFPEGIITVPNLIKLAAFADPDGYSLMLYVPV